MALNKAMLVLFLATLILCSHIASCAGENSPKEISYGAIGRNTERNPRGGGYHRSSANGYHRGCEAIERCRNGNGEVEIDAEQK